MHSMLGNFVAAATLISVFIFGWLLMHKPAEVEAAGAIPTACTEVNRHPYIFVCTIRIAGKLRTCIGSNHGLQCNL